jgi:hypothetical protein
MQSRQFEALPVPIGPNDRDAKGNAKDSTLSPLGEDEERLAKILCNHFPTRHVSTSVQVRFMQCIRCYMPQLFILLEA